MFFQSFIKFLIYLIAIETWNLRGFLSLAFDAVICGALNYPIWRTAKQIEIGVVTFCIVLFLLSAS